MKRKESFFFFCPQYKKPSKTSTTQVLANFEFGKQDSTVCSFHTVVEFFPEQWAHPQSEADLSFGVRGLQIHVERQQWVILWSIYHHLSTYL